MRAGALLVLALVLSAPAAAFKLIEGPKWDLTEGPVPYYVDDAGSEDVTDGSDVDAIKHAYKNWECVLCSSLQFRYDGNAPVRTVADDGSNVVYWVEQEPDWPFGPGTISASILGVCQGGGGPSDSDIVFNGVHHTWSTTDPVSADADIESIAAHEIGHFVGLDHPCEDENDPETCLPVDQAIMFPVYPGGTPRKPRSDDEAGICEMFPPGKECGGGLVIGEPCAENCECEPGLRCLLGLDDQRYCAPVCAGDDSHCPRDMICLLGSRRGTTGTPAIGSCAKTDDPNTLPASAACERDVQCESRNCGLVPDLGRTACVVSCVEKEQCGDGFLCLDNRCVLANADRGVPCPEDPEPEECGCANLSAPTAGLLGALLLLGLLLRRRGGAALLVAALALSPLARATVVEPMDLERMIELSDVIVHGRVLAVETFELEPRGLILREVTLRVDEAVLGAEDGALLTFVVPGGELGERRQIVPGASSYAPGDEVVLMLSRWQDRLVQIAVGRGKLKVDRAAADGPRVYDVISGVPGYVVDADGTGQLAPRQPLPDLALEDLLRELHARVEYR